MGEEGPQCPPAWRQRRTPRAPTSPERATTPQLLPGCVPRMPDAEATHLRPWGGAVRVPRPGRLLSAPMPQFPLLGTECHSGKCLESSGNQSFMGTVSPCVSPYNLHHSVPTNLQDLVAEKDHPLLGALVQRAQPLAYGVGGGGQPRDQVAPSAVPPLRAACSAHFSGPLPGQGVKSGCCVAPRAGGVGLKQLLKPWPWRLEPTG